jgi:hypothetical protein
VLVVDGGPFGQQLDRLLGAVLEGALQRAFGRDCHDVKLTRDDRRARFLISSAASASRVTEWLNAGAAYGDVLARLQTQAGAV